jgi:DNA invertase Pin-like site-specific DNA recombinase
LPPGPASPPGPVSRFDANATAEQALRKGICMLTNGRHEEPTKKTVLYERLSRDDELQGESNSIVNQRRLLEEFAERNQLVPFLNICDDGYSGTNFDRPGWRKLIGEIEAGAVSVLILKDLSRMGRDYLRVGLYMEMFREKGVRLIAVNDGVDTEKGEDDFTPFRNIMAEWYARDTSRKIKSVLNAKGRDGKPLGTIPLYGFKKDPDDADKRLIDEEAAAVVRRIFQLTIDGKGPWQIAKILTGEQVERPSYYFVRQGIVASAGKCDFNLRYNWRGTTIIKILKQREYMGDMVNFKTTRPSYKDKKQILNPPEKQLVFEDALPAIVDRETWELAQKLRHTRRRPDKRGEANPLTGHVFCADCGAPMYNRRSGYKENENGEWTYAVDVYECSVHRNAGEKFIEACSLHFIRSAVIQKRILETIRQVGGYVRENEAEFIQKIHEASSIRQAEEVKAHRRQLAEGERRIVELDKLFQKVYEDNAMGKLSDERYERLSGTYEQEQAELKERIVQLREELETFRQNDANADRFVELIRRYPAFDTLTTPMLNEFVDKVVVHEADKSSGERIQPVEIYLNYIGKFEAPATSLSAPAAEDLDKQERRRQKQARQREYNRRWYAKQKEKKEAQAKQQDEPERRVKTA